MTLVTPRKIARGPAYAALRSPARRRVIRCIAERARLAQFDHVERFLGCSQRTASRLVNALEACGLVEIWRGENGYSIHLESGALNYALSPFEGVRPQTQALSEAELDRLPPSMRMRKRRHGPTGHQVDRLAFLVPGS